MKTHSKDRILAKGMFGLTEQETNVLIGLIRNGDPITRESKLKTCDELEMKLRTLEVWMSRLTLKKAITQDGKKYRIAKVFTDTCVEVCD